MSSRASGAMRNARVGSSSLAVGTATAFIAIAAGLSFIADDGASRPPAGWALRGSIASESAPAVAKVQQVKVRQVERQQVARSDLD